MCNLTARWNVRHLAMSIAVALTALVGALMPFSPAHAAFGSNQTVYLQLTANDGYGTQLARLNGTIAFDNGNQKYRYSLRLCWQNAYPAPNLRVYVNDSSSSVPAQTGTSSESGCQMVLLYSHTVNYGSTVRNVHFTVTGGWFDRFDHQYHMRTDYTYTYDNPYN
jgi:hypothetical protein